MEKLLIPGLGQGKFKIILNVLCQNIRKYSKNDVDMSKGHKSQLEMAHDGQIWNNLSIKVENDSNGLQPNE